MIPKNIKGVLFDFDGVLAKTMEDHFRAWKNALSDLGIEIEESDYYLLEGMKLLEIAKILCDKHGKSIEHYDKIVEKKVEYYIKEHTFQLYPGVEQFLDLLDCKNISKAIISASVYEQLVKSAGKKFLDRFDFIVHGDSTKEGKPSPYPYLAAMGGLGLSPEECIAVENAPLGIISAKKAGLYCIAICSTVEKEKLDKADKIVNSFNEFTELFNDDQFDS